MPIIKSAKKRVRVARKAAVRNARTRRGLKSALKTLAKKPTSVGLSAAQSELDKAVKKHVIHKNKAARLKSRAAKQAKAAGVKPIKAVKKAVAQKAAPIKKAAPKKKPAAKKQASKKK